MRVLITGGARSGKSRMAERIALRRQEKGGGRVIYIATARAGDEEMEDRIEAHKKRRPKSWETLEEELYPGRALKKRDNEGENLKTEDTVLIDCITLLVSNYLLRFEQEESPESFEDSGGNLEDKVLSAVKKELTEILSLSEDRGFYPVFVTNEVGMGVVPPSRLGRLFRDVSGRINGMLVEECEKAYFVTAGRIIDLERISTDPFEEDELF